MMTKPLLFLTALTLCCCITTLHAFHRQGCRCLWTISTPVQNRVIKQIEIFPISGHCRHTEVIVTRKNGSKVCVDPKVEWVNEIIGKNEKKNGASRSTSAPTTNF